MVRNAPASQLNTTSLADAFHKVPQLRQCCASILNDSANRVSGLKVLRQVSRQFRDMMTKDVDGYELRIRSRLMLSKRDPATALHPRESWNFLCKLRLLRLRVGVEDEEPGIPKKGTGPVIPTCEVSHHTVQLRSFLTTVGPTTLASVTSLQLNGNISSSGKPSLPVATVLAHLLATACPKLTHFTAGGSAREVIMKVFGSRCPSIRSLELICGTNELEQPCGASGFWDVPIADVFPHPQPPSPCIAALSSFPGLLSLHTHGYLHLSLTKDWAALPTMLEELRCYSVPQKLHPLLQHGLRFVALRKLHLTGYEGMSWEVELLSAFLDAAPKLQSIVSSSFLAGNSVHVRAVTLVHMQAMQRVNLRLSAGLCVERLMLRCGCEKLPEGSKGLTTEYLLARLFASPTFLSCRISITDTISPAPGCLLQLGRAFPCITSLSLSGRFCDGHLSELESCRQLTLLDFIETSSLTAGGLVRHMVQCPSVSRVHHPFNTIKTDELLELLAAARAAGAGCKSEGSETSADTAPWAAESCVFRFSLGSKVWIRLKPSLPDSVDVPPKVGGYEKKMSNMAWPGFPELFFSHFSCL